MTPDDLIRDLGLEPLEPEGGWWRQSHIDSNGTGIYYLLTRGQCSLLHQLPGPETYFYQLGAPLDLLVLHPHGASERILVGPDLEAGQRLQHVVPGGCFQGSTSTGAWTLVGTSMAPPFRMEDYVAGRRDDLVERFPDLAGRITELTHA
ncbi:MAG: cupin domain-containing protein [Acidimicrobiales bacterium]|nr:cupin domain-containing protein [Acidimicrobiales bacterium]